MASMSYKEITSSPPFTFVVGPDEKEHTIHSALVARQSAALNALINGGMKESIERRVIWKEINEEVFVRFSQYVYTGNYDEGIPGKREGEEVYPPQTPLSKKLHRLHSQAGYGGLPVVAKKNLLWDKFQALHPLPPPTPTPSLWSAANNDHTDIFLRHAQMYVFADYYGIEPLQILAIQKLHRALTSFSLAAESYHEVTQLVRCTFEQTVEKEGQNDRLRSLVCLYVACKVDELWEDIEFRNITKMFPDFATGLITSILDRLN